MAKSQVALVRFDGGFQNALDSRDLPEEALSECVNADILQPGVVSILNKSVQKPTGFFYCLWGGTRCILAPF